MENFNLQFDMSNDSFGVTTWEACDEAARILREVADKLENRNWSGKIRDNNGNTIGEYSADFHESV